MGDVEDDPSAFGFHGKDCLKSCSVGQIVQHGKDVVVETQPYIFV